MALTPLCQESFGAVKKSPRFMGSRHEIPFAQWDHEPAKARSADSLVRVFVVAGSRGQSCPRSERRFMESLDLPTLNAQRDYRPYRKHQPSNTNSRFDA